MLCLHVLRIFLYCLGLFVFRLKCRLFYLCFIFVYIFKYAGFVNHIPKFLFMKAFESSAQRSPLSVTQYFFNLEKRNHSRKTVTKLKIGDNKYVNDQFAILKEEKRFSRNLHANNIS